MSQQRWGASSGGGGGTSSSSGSAAAHKSHSGVGHACSSCYRGKTVCDGARPCQRCTRLGKPHTCADRTTTAAAAAHPQPPPAKARHTSARAHQSNQQQPPPPPATVLPDADSLALAQPSSLGPHSHHHGKVGAAAPSVPSYSPVAPPPVPISPFSSAAYDSLSRSGLGLGMGLGVGVGLGPLYPPQPPVGGVTTPQIWEWDLSSTGAGLQQENGNGGTDLVPTNDVADPLAWTRTPAGADIAINELVMSPPLQTRTPLQSDAMTSHTAAMQTAANGRDEYTTNAASMADSSQRRASTSYPSSGVASASGETRLAPFAPSAASATSATAGLASASATTTAPVAQPTSVLPRVLRLSGPSAESTDLRVMGDLMYQNHVHLGSFELFQKQLERHESEPRRVQFYFSQLSEILSPPLWSKVVNALRIPVPLSMRAPFSKEDVDTINGTNEANSSVPMRPALPFQYVDYFWTPCPILPLSNSITSGIGGPIAIMRMQRLGPFLERDDVFIKRRQLCDKQSIFSQLKRELRRSSSRARRRRRHRKRARSPTHHADDASKHHKSDHGDFTRSAHTTPSESSSLASPNLIATSSASGSVPSPNGNGETGEERESRRRRHHSGSEGESDSDDSDAESEERARQYIRGLTIKHKGSCPYFASPDTGSSGVPGTTGGPAGSGSSGSAPSDGSSSSSPLSQPPGCSCPIVQPVAMSVQVNAEWERLFGVTQSELRDIIIKEGARALQRYGPHG